MGLSRVFQQSRLFGNLTLKQNLLLAINGADTKFWKNFFGFRKENKESESIVISALTNVGLEKKADCFARELSFGQKRLVELSRAILKPHKLLMLDEPVAGVTPKLREKISEMLLDLKKNGDTVFLIEHDMNFTLGVADEVIVLDEGKVIAQGKPSKIKKNKKVLQAYLGE